MIISFTPTDWEILNLKLAQFRHDDAVWLIDFLNARISSPATPPPAAKAKQARKSKGSETITTAAPVT